VRAQVRSACRPVRSAAHELSRAECLALMGTCGAGRLVIEGGGVRIVTPVRLSLDRDQVFVAALDGAVLPPLPDGSVASVELSGARVAGRSEWSVVVTGRVRLRDRRRDPQRWKRPATGVGGLTCLAVAVELVSGHRRGAGPLPPADD
jgi:hypothetical protein